MTQTVMRQQARSCTSCTTKFTNNFSSAYLQMTVLGANFVTRCAIQLLRKPGRRPLCQIHRYPRFRRWCGQHRAYRKLRLRNSRPTVKFSTSFVEKPGQRSRLSSRKCSISLTLSDMASNAMSRIENQDRTCLVQILLSHTFLP